jgi:hypothetical protein
MKWFRFRLSSRLWLVAIAATFLAGIRSGEYRIKLSTGSWAISPMAWE